MSKTQPAIEESWTALNIPCLDNISFSEAVSNLAAYIFKGGSDPSLSFHHDSTAEGAERSRCTEG